MSWTKLAVRGAVAGLAGTVAMDAVGYARYRRRGGSRSFVAWDLSLGLEGFETAPAPAQLGRRAARALLGIELAATAPVANSVVYFTHGALWGVGHALVFRSRKPRIRDGLATGAVMWAATYGLLQAAGLYQPMREYPLPVLAKDLGVHLVFGAGLGRRFGFCSRDSGESVPSSSGPSKRDDGRRDGQLSDEDPALSRRRRTRRTGEG